jgi:hypothetical protein
MVVVLDQPIFEAKRFTRETVGASEERRDMEHMEAPGMPGTSNDPQAPDRDPLSRLVREVNESGVSFQKMADRAIDPSSGTTVSKSTFQKMAAGAVANSPGEKELIAMAVGLGKPLRVVQRAAAVQYLGYQAVELSGYDNDTRTIVAYLAGMSPRAKRRIRRIVEVEAEDHDDLDD